MTGGGFARLRALRTPPGGGSGPVVVTGGGWLTLLLAASLFALATSLAVGVTAGTSAPLTGAPLVLLGVLAASAAASAAAVRVPARRAGHSLNLRAGVITAGLLVATPVELVAAFTAGSFVAEALLVDQPRARLAHAAARAALTASLAVVVHQVLGGPAGDPTTLAVATAGLAAVVAGTVDTAAAVAGALSTGARHTARFLRRLAAATLLTDVAAASLGATVVLLSDLAGPAAAALTLPGAGTLLVGVALCTRASARGRDLQAVRRAAGAVASGDADPALSTLVAEAARALGTGRGELLLHDGPSPCRVWHADRLPWPADAEPLTSTAEAAARALSARPVLVRALPGDGPLGTALGDLDADDAVETWMVASGFDDLAACPVTVAGTPVGVLAVSGRGRGARRLSAADLEVLSALAAECSALLTVRRLTQRADELERRGDELQEQALRDDLTGLARRPLLRDRVEHALRQRGAPGSVALLYIDLDGFKQVNDQLGHAAGDDVLAAVAARLQPPLRAGDTAARIGGDEFVVLLTGLQHPDRAALVASRLEAALSEPLSTPCGELSVRASIGVAVADADDTVDTLLAAADAAMYRAKRAGRGGPAVAGEREQVAAVATGGVVDLTVDTE